MGMMKNWMMVLLFMCGTAGFAQQWQKDLNLATAKASSSNKVVLLLFSVPDACDVCDRFEKNVIKSDAFVKYAQENYVLARPDFSGSADMLTKADNLLIVEKYNKDGFFPWVVILDGNSKVLGKMGLYNDETPEEYIKKLEAITKR